MAKTEELRERGELEFIFARAGGGEVEQLAFGGFLGVAVKFGLGGRELAPDDLFEFLGELGGDGDFSAAENVRRGLSAEALVKPSAFVATDTGGDAREVAGQEEFEERAEVVERVFERRAGEKKTTAGAERAERGGVLGASVFDVLGFVGDHDGKFRGREKLLIAGERAVTRDDQVEGGEVGGGGESVVRVVDEDAQFGCEAQGFATPVFEEGGGGDDERGSWSGGGRGARDGGRVGRGRLNVERRSSAENWGFRYFQRGTFLFQLRRLHGAEEREGLEGFAEAHFVGENAGQFGAVEMPEPGDAEALIGAQLGLERARDGSGREAREIAQCGAAGAPGFGRLETGGEFLDDFLGFGDTGGADALGAAGSDGGGGVAGERALGGGEAGEFGGFE